MPYFKPLHLLYLHVPKTGGMSIEEYLYKKCGMERHETNIYGYYYDKTKRIRVENERTLQHLTYREILDRKKWFDFEEKDQLKILVSVRNPFDRILSEVFWNKKTGATMATTKEEMFHILYKYLYEEKEIFIDNHKTPQYNFFLDAKGLTMKNVQIVRTESLESDMKLFGFDDFHVHTNKNKETVIYSDYLNESSIELIVNYYAADFLHFGYSTDPRNRSYGPIRFGKYIEGEKATEVKNIENVIEEKSLTENDKELVAKTTFVTAFIRDVNVNRVTADYISFGETLLLTDAPKVVFMDRSSYAEFFEGKTYPSTHFIMFELTDMYLHELKPLITEFHLETGNHAKDTMEYIFVQCYKTEWMRLAIEKNVYGSSQFIWLDFGIYHMIRSETVLKNGLMQMATKEYNRLRIATCKFRHYVCPYDVYKRLTWNFAGSVFGGDKESLILFADIVKKKIIETIEEKHSIMWELCVWYLVKDVIPDLYDCYICGHDFRILEGY
jgi:hypothetical protein